MLKIYLIPFFLVSFFCATAQDYNFTGGTVYIDCNTGNSVGDSGGNASTYSDGENIEMTFCAAQAGFGLELSFTELDMGEGDSICLYDGNDVSSPLMNCVAGSDDGLVFQTTVNNNTGCITVHFESNNDGEVGDFAFNIDCSVRCQEVVSEISSSLPTETVDPLDNKPYVNVCIGDTLFATANALFPDNNVEYAQSVSTSTFEWDLGLGPDEDAIIGQSITQVYTEPGGYILRLSAYDDLGCRNYQDQIIKVRVAPSPEFIELEDSVICVGDADTLVGLPVGEVVGGNVVIGGVEYFLPPFFTGDTTFLPDGTGASYTSETFVTGFENNATIENCGDIVELCMRLEHSYSGDLDITIVCPNGQSAEILDRNISNLGSANFGEPFADGTVDGESSDITPGVGYNYCFSMFNNTFGTLDDEDGNFDYTYTTVPSNIDGTTFTYSDDYFPTGTYLPDGDLADLVGCPINGSWELIITDNLGLDNGWLFDWSLNISPCMYPEVDSFQVNYDFGYWDNDPSITGIVNDSNTIIVEPTVQGVQTYTYHTENQFGCKYEQDYQIYVDKFEVNATPEDTIVCEDTLQLFAEVVGVDSVCVDEYTVNSVSVNMLPENNPVSLNLGDDQTSASIPITFPFDFFCETKSNFRIISNGYLSFDLTTNFFGYGQTLPNTTTPNDLIALFWADLDPRDGGEIKHWTTGVSPNRIKVIQFTDIPHYSFFNNNVVTGQIQLYETSNIIEIHCENCESDGGNSTIGIENIDGTIGYAAPGHNATSAAAINEAWRFSPLNSAGNYVYSWSPNSDISNLDIQNPTAVPSGDVEYVVNITNFNGCTYSDTVKVQQVGNVTITPESTICLGDSIQLNVSGGLNPVWIPANTLTDAAIADPIAFPSSTTDYEVSVEFDDCIVTKNVLVNVNEVDVPIINGGATQASTCLDEPVDLTSDADPAFTNTWSGPENGNGTNITVTSTGEYTLTTVSPDGCVSQNSITVNIANPGELITDSIRNILCCNDAVTIVFNNLNSNNAEIDEIYWNGSTTPATGPITLFSDDDGIYDIRTIDVNGCESTVQFELETKCNEVNIQEVETLVAGEEHDYELISSIPYDEEVWFPISLFSNNTFSSNISGENLVYVNIFNNFVLNNGSEYSCFVSDSSSVNVINISNPEMPDAFSPNGDGLNEAFYPVNMDPNSSISEFVVYNRWGDEVYRYNNDNGWDGTWNGVDQPVDTYTYYIRINKTTEDYIHSGTISLIK